MFYHLQKRSSQCERAKDVKEMIQRELGFDSN
jgi:hypothetical protein